MISTKLLIAASSLMMVALHGGGVLSSRASAHSAVSLQAQIETSCSGHEYSEDDIIVFASVVDCTISTDTGYTEGEPFDIDVVQVDGKAMEVNTANAFLVMQAAADADGVGLGIVSGFRTYAEQEYLYGCYLNCNCNNCNLAARPGYSNHNSGHALDLNTASPGVYDWLAANAAIYGFERTVPSENWHWEWWGGGPGGGECGAESRECPTVPKDGRIIEEDDECFVGGGQREYLREVAGGHGGGLLWTKATDSETISNYALWNLNFEKEGRYEILVYTDDGEYGQSQQAAYLLTHADGEDTVVVDQSSTDEWLSLGVFRFSTESPQSVRLNDNTGEPWADDPGGVRLMFDALQVLPEEGDAGDDRGGPSEPEPEPETESSAGLIGGCSSHGGSGHGSAPWWLLAIGLVALVRRRRLTEE